MIRLFNLDIQIDTLDFACNLDFMLNDPDAKEMPWKLRYVKIMEDYGMDISEIALRRWTDCLIEIQKPIRPGCTMVDDHYHPWEKDQEPVPDDKRHLVPEYFQRRQELYKESLEVECECPSHMEENLPAALGSVWMLFLSMQMP